MFETNTDTAVNESSMSDKAKFLVFDYIEQHLDKSDILPEFKVYEVWHCYILGSEKWLISTTLYDGMYYEVTYNSATCEFYLDAYKKFQSLSIAENMLDEKQIAFAKELLGHEYND